VYAAVFLHRADCAGAFQPARRRQETASLVLNFISALDEAASDKFHISHKYSQLLRNLWQTEERGTGKSKIARATSAEILQPRTEEQSQEPDLSSATLLPLQQRCEHHEKEKSAEEALPNIQVPTLRQDPDILPLEDYPFGPFINIPDFELGDFERHVSDISLPSLNWGTGLFGM
jgi:hypothetical protein